MKNRDNINRYIQDAVCENWNRLALSDIDGLSLQFRDVARKVEKLHILYQHAGVKAGDKISICGKNSAQWAVAFLSVITYGAVAVPILHDFHFDSIQHLVNHSDSKLLFCDKSIWETLDADQIPVIEGAIDIADFSLLLSRSKQLTDTREHLNMLFGEKYPERFLPTDINYYIGDPEEIAVINYTSGSTGSPKGVMLSYRAMWSNVQFCIDGLTFLKPGDGVVCMLPLAHMYGLMVDLLHCFVKGCHINFITRLPSPKVILAAFAKVRPKLIVAVPLIIEKIIRNNVFPQLQRPSIKIGLITPGLKDLIHKSVRQKIIDAFGGNLQQLIIGGASLSPEVETFLRKIKFPFTVGYGMTECAPLVTYAPWEIQKPQSCGKIVDRMAARVDSDDPVNKPGILWVKGDNVMSGYYKNPEATDEIFQDGWMSTGDICTIDNDGFMRIHGRAKTMILGPSGQNIYPEEIEHILNNLPYVGESLVVSRDGKLEALVYPDQENPEVATMTPEQMTLAMDNNLKTLNNLVPAYSKVSKIVLMDKEFDKTPKRSIKRYLYQ